MSNLSISAMRKLIKVVDENQIPESFISRFPVESESGIDQLVKDWNGIVGKAENANSDQLDAEIKNWAKGI
jgi:hypothetical protein